MPAPVRVSASVFQQVGLARHVPILQLLRKRGTVTGESRMSASTASALQGPPAICCNPFPTGPGKWECHQMDHPNGDSECPCRPSGLPAARVRTGRAGCSAAQDCFWQSSSRASKVSHAPGFASIIRDPRPLVKPGRLLPLQPQASPVAAPARAAPPARCSVL